MAMDSDKIELPAVRAICLAPFKHGPSRSASETFLAHDLQLYTFCNSFTWAASGRSCLSKRIWRATPKFITHAFIAPFEDGKPMAVLTPFSPILYRPFIKQICSTRP